MSFWHSTIYISLIAISQAILWALRKQRSISIMIISVPFITWLWLWAVRIGTVFFDFIFRCYFYGHELACWNNNNSLRPGTFLLSVVAAGQAKAKQAIARCPTIKLFGYRFTFSESIKRLMAIKSFHGKLL